MENGGVAPQMQLLLSETKMIGDPPIKDYHARSYIAMDDPAAVRCWTKHLHVTNDELQRAVEKVGNSVVAVRKQLSLVEAR